MSHEQQLQASDDRARQEALDIGRSFIVQAPAGSGKTELLIQRYLKLLGSVEEPEEVLAITFTRKAAAEMQLRVIDALRLADSGATADEPHRELTLALARDVLQQSSRHNWRLTDSPRRMRILTLDALNASIIRSRPFSSLASSGRIVVNADLKDLHRQAATSTLDWLQEGGEYSAATREVLTHLDNSTGLFIAYLAQMLATRDQWLPIVGSGSFSSEDAAGLRREFESTLSGVVEDHLKETALRLCRQEYERLPGVVNPENPTLPGRLVTEAGRWRELANLLLVANKPAFRKRVDVRQGFPKEEGERKEAMHELLADMADDDVLAELLHAVRSLPPVQYSDEQWQVLLALFRLLPLAVIELQRLFVEQGMADHIEVALNAGEALGSATEPGDVALLLDYRISHILVDEMQDTSSAQYRMLEALTGGWQRGDGRTLFCVGDPMQSIYRFRNAEVGQFLLAREKGIGEIPLEPLVLRRNFRSGEFLVHWFNTVFPTVLADEDDPARGAVAYAEATPAPHLAGIGDCEVHAVFGDDSEAIQGADVLQKLLQEHSNDTAAVLVRGRTQLPALLAELRRRGIDYTAVEIDRLTDLPEIIDLLALTRAALHPGDRIAWLGLLRAPWIGMTWTDIHALAQSDARSTVPELLQDEQRRNSISAEGQAALQRALPTLAQLQSQSRTGSLRDRVERCWLELGGPALLVHEWQVENVYRFLDLLERQEAGGSVPDVADLESILDEERVSNSVPSKLQIMTMHKAKGLEFDHVLLYGLGRMPGRSNPGVLSWLDLPDEHGRERKIISPVGPRAEVERDELHRYIATTNVAKDRQEQARLLYVACTRARKSLHLMGNVAVAPDGGDFRAARSDSLLHWLWPAVEPAFADAFSRWQAPDEVPEEALWIEPVLKRLDREWQLPELLPLPGTAEEQELAVPDDEVEFYWVGTEARIAGTLVHRWLQAFAVGSAATDIDAGTRESVTRRWLRETGISGESADAVLQRVERAVQAVLDDERGRWLLGGDGHAELPLTGFHDGEVVSVVLDRVRIEQDVHWIVDYKTSTHEGGNIEGFLQVERERYSPQLQRYAALYSAWSGATVRCALYFPLLGAFVEVDAAGAG